MNTKLYRTMKDESGITALETAIILIAFVVVAAIFAFTVLTTGTFLTERSKEAAYAGLQEVRGSMELKGSLVLTSDSTLNQEWLIFNLSNVTGGSSQDLSKTRITFRSSTVNYELTMKVLTDGTTWVVPGAGEWVSADLATPTSSLQILSQGKVAKISIRLPSTVTIAANDQFALEIKPMSGGVLLIERTAPAYISAVTDLR